MCAKMTFVHLYWGCVQWWVGFLFHFSTSAQYLVSPNVVIFLMNIFLKPVQNSMYRDNLFFILNPIKKKMYLHS